MVSSIAVAGNTIPHVSCVVRMGMVPKKTKLLHRLTCKLGTISVANSYAGLQAWGIPRRKGRVVYNGFDWGRVLCYKTDSSTVTKTFSILMTASMSPNKDWQAFLSTARCISNLNRYQDITFYGFGDGSCRNKILNSAMDLLESKILYLPGHTSDPILKCQNADVGILLSPFGEGISNSIMEYMACGLPVICTNSGGNPELVIDGVTGFLVDPDNPSEQIAEKILWLKNNPKKAKAMGIAGMKLIKTNFSTKQMLESYVEIYQEVISNCR